MRKIPDKDIQSHFWSKVRILDRDRCWMWLGGKFTNGYGRFYLHRKATPAHRLSYIFTNGYIPKGLEICHKCDVPLCVNPNHLFVGTHKENMYDALEKGRIPAPPTLYGKDNSASKLKESDIRKIFYLYNKGETKASIGRKFKVTKQAIGLILSRVNWAWVKLEENK